MNATYQAMLKAYAEGKRAYNLELDIGECPYPYEANVCSLYKTWRAGWHKAEKKKEK